MNSIKDLKIYIVEYNPYTASVVKDAFKSQNQVTVYNGDIYEFYFKHQKEIDALVSPANAFGIMAGGYDARLSDILGWDFQDIVQQYIHKNYQDGQTVGTSLIFKTSLPHLSLIHTPSMKKPGTLIKDPSVISRCVESTLKCALDNNLKCIVIPVFGGATGGVEPKVAANEMLKGYLKIYK